MFFFDDDKNVNEYIEMVDGFDGRELINRLPKYLDDGSTVLELGSGPGKDLIILNEKYDVTGSDISGKFLEHIKKTAGNIKTLKINAISIDTVEKFDCIFSNKVLQHLEVNDFKKSLKRQSEVLNDCGIIFHSLWRGSGKEEFDGLLFQYYEIEDLKKILIKNFDLIEISYYTEMDKDDSIYFILKKKP